MGESAAIRNGIASLLGADEQDQTDTLRVHTNQVGQLEVGPLYREVRFNRSGGRLSSIELDFVRNGVTRTATLTFTRSGGRLSVLSEPVIT